MKVRKKPIVIESVQFTQEMVDRNQLPDGVSVNPAGGFLCSTLEGPLQTKVGEWIMTGTRGEHWPVRNDIFLETYEVV